MADDRTTLRRLHRMPEHEALEPLVHAATPSPDRAAAVQARARALDRAARAVHRPGVDVSDFPRECRLGTTEGVALLFLAEALLRIPDSATVDALIEDRMRGADWERHLGHGVESTKSSGRKLSFTFPPGDELCSFFDKVELRTSQ